MSEFGIILILLLVISYIVIGFVMLRSINHVSDAERIDEIVNNQYMKALSFILLWAEQAADECCESPEDRQILLDYINEFDELIIENRINIDV